MAWNLVPITVEFVVSEKLIAVGAFCEAHKQQLCILSLLILLGLSSTTYLKERKNLEEAN